jgi:hypothetical protein
MNVRMVMDPAVNGAITRAFIDVVWQLVMALTKPVDASMVVSFALWGSVSHAQVPPVLPVSVT